MRPQEIEMASSEDATTHPDIPEEAELKETTTDGSRGNFLRLENPGCEDA